MVTSLVILAGGDGTRLKKITGPISKPLIKIGDIEVLTSIIDKMTRELPVAKIFILIQEKHRKQYISYLSSRSPSELDIELVVERTKLGTGGAIKNFLKNYRVEKFYVTNADTLIRTDITEFQNAKINSILCTKIKRNKRFGSLKVDNQNNIVSFAEKVIVSDAIISAGVYKLHRSLFQGIKENQFDLEKIIFPKFAAQKILKCFLMNLEFEDIGVPGAYFREVERSNRGG